MPAFFSSNKSYPLPQKPITAADDKLTYDDIFRIQNTLRALFRDLDSRFGNFTQYQSGGNYPLPGIVVASTRMTAAGAMANQLHAFPIPAGEYSDLTLRVNISNAFRGSWKAGLYAFNPATRVFGNLIKDLGEFTITAASTVADFPNQIGTLNQDAAIAIFTNQTAGGFLAITGSTAAGNYPITLNTSTTAQVPAFKYTAAAAYPYPATLPATLPTMNVGTPQEQFVTLYKPQP